MRKHHRDVLAILVKAGNSARRLSPTQWVWDVSFGCSNPTTVTLTGRPDPGRYRDVMIGPGTAHTLEVHMETACRRCEHCVRRRRSIWTARAIAETTQASRTWFGTLTIRPEEQYRAACAAQTKAERAGYDWNTLTEEQRFGRIHGEHTAEITRYLKRVRKESGVRLRFLAVAESHKSGLPHYHLLVHEQGAPVTYRILDEQWKLGFSKWKLVDVGAARYVTKYLTKENGARVRASVRYGVVNVVAREQPEPALRHKRPERSEDSPTGGRGTRESEGLCENPSPEPMGSISQEIPRGIGTELRR